MARAIVSASNVASSLRAPPPRMTTMASRPRCDGVERRAPGRPGSRAGRGLRALHPGVGEHELEAEAAAHAARRGSRATPPCRRSTRRRRAAAPGSARRRPLASSDPSAASRRSTCSRCWARSPSVKRGSRSDIFRPSEPARGVEVEVAEDAHLHAVAEAQPVLLQQRAQAHPGVGEELDPHDGLAARRVVGRA